ncbi:MAG: leucine-rich repeat domain-containing protein [Holosporaceae bacterium]|nr:leucine-rich repeat domain-containing protein [Holosporaceae bacterium]
MKFASGLLLTSPGFYAFSNCDSLQFICIPRNVRTIEYWAFYGCVSLTSVSTERGSRLLWIGEGAFNECRPLTFVSFPSRLWWLTDDHPCFNGCKTRPQIFVSP